MRSRCIALLTLNRGAKRGLEVTALARPLYPGGSYQVPILQGDSWAS